MVTAEQLDRLSPLVDAELRRVVSGRGLPLYSMMEHQLGWDADGQGMGGALGISATQTVGRVVSRGMRVRIWRR